jgi:hypothetical protein
MTSTDKEIIDELLETLPLGSQTVAFIKTNNLEPFANEIAKCDTVVIGQVGRPSAKRLKPRPQLRVEI